MKITVTMTLDTHNPADAVVIDELLAKQKAEAEEDIDIEDLTDLLFNENEGEEEEFWWEDEDEDDLEGDLW